MLNKISIKGKLIALFIMPLLVVIFLLVLNVISLLNEYSNATKAASIDEIKKVGNLIHELQIERGLTAGFLASNGSSNKDSLRTQRKKVDLVLNDLSSFQKILNIDISNTILSDLNGKRDLIDSLSLTPSQGGVIILLVYISFLSIIEELFLNQRYQKLKMI